MRTRKRRKLTATSRSANSEPVKLKVLISTYYKGEAVASNQSDISGTIELPDFYISSKLNKPQVDVQKDGNFSIAYVAEESKDLTYKTYEGFEAAYNGDETTAYTNTFSRYINTIDCQAFDTSINSSTPKKYLPFSEMGFIPVMYKSKTKNKTTLSGTSLQDDLDVGKVLKFELYGSEDVKDGGIDFKYVIPIHNYEQSQQTYKDISYHQDGTEHIMCYSFTEDDDHGLHFFESDLNKYVRESDDATFWDHTDAEKETYLSVRTPQKDTISSYLDLANYDVMQYLSVLRDEDATSKDNSTDISKCIDSDEMTAIIQPYLVSQDDLTSDTLKTYVNGYYTPPSTPRSINTGKFIIVLDENEISASWISNDENPNRVKIDFNADFYKRGEMTNYQNVRNRYHCFLNLDRPGDAGYLFLWSQNDVDTSHRLNYKLFIKNISEPGHPRFIMKSIDLDLAKNRIPITGATSNRLKAVKGTSYVPTLAVEGFETKFISFT